MNKLLVPVLFLATTALSSSNVLPIASMHGLNPEQLGFNYQDNDNTYSSKQQHRNNLNAILFNVNVDPDIDKIPQANYMDSNEDFNSVSKDDNYNVKGFRKEQWHNYPRQLDRLNRYFYQHQSADKRNLDPDDPNSEYLDDTDSNQDNFDDLTDEYDPTYSEAHTDNEAEMAAAVINPLLIFRIHLAYFNNNKAVTQPSLESINVDNERIDSNKEENNLSKEINPGSNQIKVKREGKINLEDVDTARKLVGGSDGPRIIERSGGDICPDESTENRTVNKRIFALFSRLQSLNPKGHQLHHRRHMYALYGPPDGEGGGVLTAETRATFMRPPGSPLRWG